MQPHRWTGDSRTTTLAAATAAGASISRGRPELQQRRAGHIRVRMRFACTVLLSRMDAVLLRYRDAHCVAVDPPNPRRHGRPRRLPIRFQFWCWTNSPSFPDAAPLRARRRAPADVCGVGGWLRCALRWVVSG